MTDGASQEDVLEEARVIDRAFYRPGAPDWDDLAYRVESRLNIDLPEQWVDPLMKAIKSAVRKDRRESA